MPGRKRAPYAHRDGPLDRIVLSIAQWSVCPGTRSGSDHHTRRGAFYIRDAQRPGVCGVARWYQATSFDAGGSGTDILASADGALGAQPHGRWRATLDRAAECG